MSERDDEKLAKAAMKALRVPAPAGLKDELKRRARARAAQPSVWDALRELLSGGAWAYGAGAAFAAAGVAALLIKAIPDRPAPAAPVVHEAAASPADLAALWSDDDGEDHD